MSSLARLWGQPLPVQGPLQAQAPLPRLRRLTPQRPLGGRPRGGGRPWPPRASAWGRGFVDTDAYETDVCWDSDDYEFETWEPGHRAAVAAHNTSSGRSPWLPRGAQQQPAAAAAAAAAAGMVGSLAAPASTGAQEQQPQYSGAPQQGDDAASPPGSAGETVLLLGSAVLVFLQRLQVAVVATAGAVLQLAQQAAKLAVLQARLVAVQARKALRRSAAGDKLDQLRQRTQAIAEQLPEGFWGKLLWLWDRPPVQKLRLTWSLANISIKLPAVLALVATQVGLLASQVSLPMLAPLLLGTGMLLRSIKSNASFLFPRIGLFVVLAWLLWFVNSVVQSTVAYLRRQNAIDNRVASAVITASECSALLGALLILLSMLGINIGSALLLPAGIAVAIAAKDLSTNWVAGFFLFVAQPFKMGDRVAVSFTAPGAPGAFTSNWFEGVCEKIDLRYTMIRQGSRRLMVPNQAFLTREFMILDDVPAHSAPSGAMGHGSYTAAPAYVPSPEEGEDGGEGLGGDHHEGLGSHDWAEQMMQRPPYHHEVLDAAHQANGAAAFYSQQPQQEQGSVPGGGVLPGQQHPPQQQRPARRANGRAAGPQPQPEVPLAAWQPRPSGYDRRSVPGYETGPYYGFYPGPPAPGHYGYGGYGPPYPGPQQSADGKGRQHPLGPPNGMRPL